MPRWTGLQYTEPGDDGSDSESRGSSSLSMSGAGSVDFMGHHNQNNNNNNAGNREIWSESRQAFTSSSSSSSGMKSTRHLPPQSKYESPFHKNFYTHRAPTLATVQVHTIYLLNSFHCPQFVISHHFH